MSLKGDINGVEALADWLGDGGTPVSDMVAEFRAARCVRGNDGKACPLNLAPNWWEKAKHVIADWIKAELEIKNKMDLKTSLDKDLAICKACGCCLQLKVWTPAKHLRATISKPQIAETPSYCWMRRELLNK